MPRNLVHYNCLSCTVVQPLLLIYREGYTYLKYLGQTGVASTVIVLYLYYFYINKCALSLSIFVLMDIMVNTLGLYFVQ